MTEKRYKRFVSSIDYYYCTDSQNENQGLTEKDMLNRLNEQDKRIKELEEENEKLKQDRNEMFIRERDTENELRDIKYENEQLKKENKELNDIIDTIEKDYENRYGMSIRNADWFTAW